MIDDTLSNKTYISSKQYIVSTLSFVVILSILLASALIFFIKERLIYQEKMNNQHNFKLHSELLALQLNNFKTNFIQYTNQTDLLTTTLEHPPKTVVQIPIEGLTLTAPLIKSLSTIYFVQSTNPSEAEELKIDFFNSPALNDLIKRSYQFGYLPPEGIKFEDDIQIRSVNRITKKIEEQTVIVLFIAEVNSKLLLQHLNTELIPKASTISIIQKTPQPSLTLLSNTTVPSFHMANYISLPPLSKEIRNSSWTLKMQTMLPPIIEFNHPSFLLIAFSYLLFVTLVLIACYFASKAHLADCMIDGQTFIQEYNKKFQSPFTHFNTPFFNHFHLQFKKIFHQSKKSN